MDLPDSVAALGEQLRGADEVVPDPALLCEAEVFAAERDRIFARSLLAVDHATRLSEDGRYFRCDAAPRSMILARDKGGRLHALSNLCLHAGYPICDAEEGSGERLICPYHGWEYTFDGRLVEPNLSARIDSLRLQVMRYPVWVRNGLIFVDPSGKTDAVDKPNGSAPTWLATPSVERRGGGGAPPEREILRPLPACAPPPVFVQPPPRDARVGPRRLLSAR